MCIGHDVAIGRNDESGTAATLARTAAIAAGRGKALEKLGKVAGLSATHGLFTDHADIDHRRRSLANEFGKVRQAQSGTRGPDRLSNGAGHQ